MLVLISSTHGVEGHRGWVRRSHGWRPAAREAAQGHRCVDRACHQSLRLRLDPRVNEDNVDLNRNFVDHDKAYPKNDGYLGSPTRSAPGVEPGEQGRDRSAPSPYTQKHGAYALQGAISSGRYTHPDGIFFGGAGRPGE